MFRPPANTETLRVLGLVPPETLLSKRPCLTRHGVVGSRQALHPRPTIPPCRAPRRRSAWRRRGGHGRGGPPLPDPARLRGNLDAVMMYDFIKCPSERRSLTRRHTYGHRYQCWRQLNLPLGFCTCLFLRISGDNSNFSDFCRIAAARIRIFRNMHRKITLY